MTLSIVGGLRASSTSVAMRRMFAMIEAKYGGLSNFLDIGNRAEVITRVNYIESHDLNRLMTHEATALHVKAFYDKDGEHIRADLIDRRKRADNHPN